jgi:hypothetical protein
MNRSARRWILVWLVLVLSSPPLLMRGQDPPEMKDPTPGTSLQANRIVRMDSRGRKMPDLYEGHVAYTLRAKGFPTKEKLYLWYWRRGWQPRDLKATPVVVMGRGDEIRQFENAKNHYSLAFPSTVSGLGFVIMLATVDGKIRTWTTVTPNPIEAKSGACELSAEIIEGPGATYDVSAKGFQPGEDLKITTIWADQSQESSGKVKDDGTWSGQVKLNVTNQDSFEARLTLAGKSCSVSVALERKNPPPIRTNEKK